VTDFAEPILAAISKYSPTIDDNLDSNLGGWTQTSYCNGSSKVKFENGEAIISCNFATRSNMAYKDFVLEFDIRLVEDIGVPYRGFSVNYLKYYGFELDPGGGLHVSWKGGKTTFDILKSISPFEKNRIRIIAKGNRYAFYVNNEPVYYLEDNYYFSKEPISFTSNGSTLDNLKIWDLSGVDFSTSAETTAITPTPTPKVSANPDTKILNRRILNPANQHLYLYVEQTKTWSAARDYCAEQGGYLVTIQDAKENMYIYNLTNEGWAWLGATDEVNEGTWVWVSGEPWKYSKWAYQQPSGDDYLTYKAGLAGDNNWDDVVVDSRPFICEWEPTP
jgi:hypothetical protein